MINSLCVTVYTDGSYCPDRKVGGWAFWVKYEGRSEIISGHVPQVADCNRMEMIAVEKAIGHVHTMSLRYTTVVLVTDSQYVLDELLKKPLMLPETCRISMRKIKSHSGGTKRGDYVNRKVDIEARKQLNIARKLYDEQVRSKPCNPL